MQNSRGLTIGGRTLTTTFPNTCTITISFKNNRAKSKRIAMELCMGKVEIEEIIVEQQEAGTTALAATKTYVNVELAEKNLIMEDVKTT